MYYQAILKFYVWPDPHLVLANEEPASIPSVGVGVRYFKAR